MDSSSEPARPAGRVPVSAWIRLALTILLAVLLLLMLGGAEAPIPLYQGF